MCSWLLHVPTQRSRTTWWWLRLPLNTKGHQKALLSNEESQLWPGWSNFGPELSFQFRAGMWRQMRSRTHRNVSHGTLCRKLRRLFSQQLYDLNRRHLRHYCHCQLSRSHPAGTLSLTLHRSGETFTKKVHTLWSQCQSWRSQSTLKITIDYDATALWQSFFLSNLFASETSTAMARWMLRLSRESMSWYVIVSVGTRIFTSMPALPACFFKYKFLLAIQGCSSRRERAPANPDRLRYQQWQKPKVSVTGFDSCATRSRARNIAAAFYHLRDDDRNWKKLFCNRIGDLELFLYFANFSQTLLGPMLWPRSQNRLLPVDNQTSWGKRCCT